MGSPLLRAATAHDARGIRALLDGSGLPISDLESARPEFVVACEDGEVIGAGALQCFGSAALLRSVAVAPAKRGCGLGDLLVRELERHARSAQVRELVLLTQTARGFFERHGYRIIDRQSVPQAVQATEEFRTLCPASATCMSKIL